jgi:hypothetical protein
VIQLVNGHQIDQNRMIDARMVPVHLPGGDRPGSDLVAVQPRLVERTAHDHDGEHHAKDGRSGLACKQVGPGAGGLGCTHDRGIGGVDILLVLILLALAIGVLDVCRDQTVARSRFLPKRMPSLTAGWSLARSSHSRP